MSYHSEVNAWAKKETGADEVKHITTIKMTADAEDAVEIAENETAKIKEAARIEGKERKHFPAGIHGTKPCGSQLPSSGGFQMGFHRKVSRHISSRAPGHTLQVL
ncbi:hypothetical protein AVEN_66042-1 [Araneus ventricosus]|uniref:Uncharacterized protein n=1 Tax=Araneus ventricosus TaxID=182803 RepID=A0A4Y2JZ12_ARAVE|nr:hypothetical protein AVEN_66042-1 [Araneus ventricosus]